MNRTLLMSFIGAACVAASSLNAQIQLSPVADTFLEGGNNLGAGESNAGTNYGTNDTLIVKTQAAGSATDNGRSAWFRFDGTSLHNSYAPEDVTLTFNGANLVSGGPFTFNLWGLSEASSSENFVELDLTFTSLDSNLKSASVGADSHGAIDVSSPLAISLGSVVADSETLTFSSVALADFLNSDTNNVLTFFLTRSTQDNAVTAQIFSREHATLGPVLAVPEPSTYAAIFGGLVLGFAVLRRRKQA